MNPNDNNPTAPSGTSGSGMSPLDFTNPDTLNNSSSLSMSDSLASAQDNLTSAGQAAPSTSNAIGLDQLGMDKPSASMDTPNQPLTPAAPVPGSIGSVTSVPPVNTSDSLGSNATMPPVNTAPSTPAPTPVTTSNMPNMGGGASSSTGNGKPYFNPFASNSSTSSSSAPSTTPATSAMPSNAPTSSTNVPPALQSQGEKFSDRLGKTAAPKSGNHKMFGIIGWVLAIVFLISTVVLFVMWQNAEQAAKEKEIIYIERDPVEDTLSMLNCTQNLGADEELGLEGMTWHSRDMSAAFRNDDLASMTLFNTYTFENGDFANNAEWYVNDLNAYYTDAAANLGIGELGITNELDGAIRTYNVGLNANQLVGDFVGIFMLNTNEDGNVLTSREDIKQAYENAGFVCAVE